MNNYLYMLPVALLLFANACSRQDRQGEPLPDFEQLVLKEYIEPYKTGDTEGWLEVFADDRGRHAQHRCRRLEGKQACAGSAERPSTALSISGNWT